MLLSRDGATAITLAIQNLKDTKNDLLSDIEKKHDLIDDLTNQRFGLEYQINAINLNIEGVNKDRQNMQDQVNAIDKSIEIMTQDLKDGGF